MQPTNTTCEHTTLSMLFDYYDRPIAVNKIIEKLPCVAYDDGSEIGIFSQTAAAFAAKNGFDVDLYSFDYFLVDQSWAGLQTDELITKFELIRGKRADAGNLGTEFSDLAIDSYIDFLRSGGRLHIERYPSKEILRTLLKNGPIHLTLCDPVIYGDGGRTRNDVGLRESIPDDIYGHITMHAVILRGYENDKFLLSDPWYGETIVDAEALIAVIMAAQATCDNMLFQIKPKEK